MDLQLEDKVVLVTGGTGAIGREIVRIFIEEGAKVYFLYNRAEKKAAELMATYGEDRCKGLQSSVLDQANLARLTQEICAACGTIDVLVNNAGMTDVLPFPLIEEEDWDACLDVNAKGAFLVTKETARYMIKRRSGTIINMGSLAGERILEVPVHYATAKAALTGFTLALTKELSRYNIRVNCVVPGLVDGGVGRSATDRQRQQYLEYCTSGRLAKPEEVADLIAFLASPRAAYVNGQIIHIDGGI